MEGIECERCGTMIKTGRYCEACKLAVGNDLRSVMNKSRVEQTVRKSAKDKDRMRFLQN